MMGMPKTIAIAMHKKAGGFSPGERAQVGAITGAIGGAILGLTIGGVAGLVVGVLFAVIVGGRFSRYMREPLPPSPKPIIQEDTAQFLHWIQTHESQCHKSSADNIANTE